jgi:hypothetical protein
MQDGPADERSSFEPAFLRATVLRNGVRSSSLRFGLFARRDEAKSGTFDMRTK